MKFINSLSNEFVTHASYRKKMLWVFRIFFEVLSEGQNVIVDGSS